MGQARLVENGRIETETKRKQALSLSQDLQQLNIQGY
jgi:hypothetical protein